MNWATARNARTSPGRVIPGAIPARIGGAAVVETDWGTQVRTRRCLAAGCAGKTCCLRSFSHSGAHELVSITASIASKRARTSV